MAAGIIVTFGGNDRITENARQKEVRATMQLVTEDLDVYKRQPERLRTLIASGDVYIRAEKPLQEIPDADVVCYGLWVDPVSYTHLDLFL